MIERILTVGGFTLLSRVTGFVRDIMLAAVLGAGPVADAFFVALRLPNHFRAIFAEGAFNAAFVPAYARIREQAGAEPARLFADRIFTLLLAIQVVLLAVALLFTPAVIALLAPGFANDPVRFALAVELTRITFPYLLLITLVTLYGGILNALGRFAAAAAAPILLNLSMMMALALAAFFPTAGHAAAWGVLVAGVSRSRCWSPATPGGRACCRRSAGRGSTRGEDLPQALRARDRRLGRRRSSRCSPTPSSRASLPPARCRRCITPTGSTSCRSASSASPPAPCCCRRWRSRIAAGDEAGARHAQNRAIEFTLLLSMPCIVAFLLRARADHARAVHARRLHRGRRAGGRRDACGLCDRPAAVRADPQRGGRRSWRAATPGRR